MENHIITEDHQYIRPFKEEAKLEAQIEVLEECLRTAGEPA